MATARKETVTAFRVIEETVEWNASETAIIICDMWADHPCKLAGYASVHVWLLA